MKNKFHFFPPFHLPFSIPHFPFSSAKALLPANIALKGSKDVQYLAIALNKTYTSHQTRSSQSSFTLHTQIYYRHMYTCGYILWAMHMYTCNILQAHVYVRIYIFLMLLRLAVHICIRAKILRAYVYVRRYIYIMAYHLLLDSTKPYSGKPPHRASHGQA